MAKSKSKNSWVAGSGVNKRVKKALRRLEIRQADFEAIKGDKRGFTRPGSMQIR